MPPQPLPPRSPAARSPESLIPRTDSKNPASTCRGTTSTGRPCRRALALTLANARFPQTAGNTDTDTNIAEARLYCYQHKDQAPVDGAASGPWQEQTQKPGPSPEKRNSLDTLIEQLGAFSVVESQRRRQHPRHDGRPKPAQRPPARKSQKQQGWFTALCCFASSGRDNDDDCVEIVRHRRRTHDRPQPQPQPHPRPEMSLSASSYTLDSSPAVTVRPQQNPSPLSLIPPSLPAQTASALLAELGKPISDADEEGYIYIFWLTPSSSSSTAPNSGSTSNPVSAIEAAQSLLAPPGDAQQQRRPGPGAHRQSELLRQYSVRSSEPGAGSAPGARGELGEKKEKRKVLLKIGRTGNVHRRMGEWTRQCGYDVSLLRFYPYVPAHLRSSPQPPSSRSPSPGRDGDVIRKVPHSHRVERLIHIELSGRRYRDGGRCERCGREHREWFEVDADRGGLREVDGCVRRWVAWAEGVGG